MGIARQSRARQAGRQHGFAVPELEAAVLALLAAVLATVSFIQLFVGGSWPWAAIGLAWLLAGTAAGVLALRVHRRSGRRERSAAPAAPVYGRGAAR